MIIFVALLLNREGEKELGGKLSELVKELKDKYLRKKEGKINVRDRNHPENF